MQEVLGLNFCRCMLLLYVENGVVGSRYPECIQGTLNVIIGLFLQHGLVTNDAKSKSITCQLGTLQAKMSEEAMRRQCTGRGATYQDRLRRRILCQDCVVEFTSGSSTAHIKHIHGMEL